MNNDTSKQFTPLPAPLTPEQLDQYWAEFFTSPDEVYEYLTDSVPPVAISPNFDDDIPF